MVAATLKALQEFVAENDGHLAISFGFPNGLGHPSWSAALNWGRESSGSSPTASGQAIYAADTLEEALGLVAAKAGVEVPEAEPLAAKLADALARVIVYDRPQGKSRREGAAQALDLYIEAIGEDALPTVISQARAELAEGS